MGNDEFDASLSRLRLLSRRDLDTNKLPKDLDASGRDKLYAMLQRSIHLDTFTELDVQLFAMSALFDERYDVNPDAGHPGLVAINTEYDPPKNGANVVKHGLSFNDITQTSTFGTLMVRVPHERDGERVVIFSTLDAGDKGARMTLPRREIHEVIYTLTIAQQIGFKFRLISSRRISPGRLRRDIKGAVKDLKLPLEEQSSFVDHCTARIEEWLKPLVEAKRPQT